MNNKPTYEELEQKIKGLEEVTIGQELLEREIKKNQERLELAIEGANLGMWDWNIQTGGVYFSERCLEILGYSPYEIEPHVSAWENLIHPEDVAAVMESLNKNLNKKESFECLHRLRAKSGEWRWILARGKVFEWDGEGEPLRHSGTYMDITEHMQTQLGLKDTLDKLEQRVEERTAKLSKINKELEKEIEEREQVETALRDSERRFKEIADLLPTIICEIDTSGYITYVNDIGLEIFGYSKSDLEQGINIRDIIHPGDKDKMYKRIKEIISGEKGLGNEYRLLRKDGADLLSIVYASPINNNGEIIGLRMSVTDITERQKLEYQLQQSQKMEAIGTLSGGIAHDFNNILAVIIGLTEISMLDGQESYQIQENLEGILNAGERAKDLVMQILTFSRQTEQELKPIQMDVIVKEVLKLIRASLPTTIDIRHDIKSFSPIMGDPTQLHQVLMNLCTNASHAMQEKGGVLEVGLENIEIDSEYIGTHPDLEPGNYLALMVSDTGHGMTPDTLNKIFDPFFTTKGKGEGTGLGLSVVHGIVKSFGGAIYAYSEPEKGSMFKVLLPIIERGIETAERKEKVIPKGTEHILFIDDEPTVVDTGRQLLESLGYKVTTRTSSLEALKLFKAKPDEFDLVLTDMTMPIMTGDNLTEELMAIRPNVLVILCTGFGTMITKEKAISKGVRAIVMKPILRRELALTIRKVLDEA